MLNETYPNQPPERRRRLPGVGVPEVVFGIGCLLAAVGLAGWLGIWIAMLAAGIALMAVTWRLS